MFERFTERARQVIVLAQEEARSLRHDYIGTEHILLGLLREEEGIAARVLESLDINVERVRPAVVRIVGSGEEVTSGQIPFTPRTKKVLELALREALSLGHNYIGTEHLLLGLARVNEGVAADVLLELHADSENIRNQVIRMLSGPGGRQWGPGPGRVRVGGSSAAPAGDFPDTLIEGATRLVERVAREVEEQLGRKPDSGDLLVMLACIADGLTARALARLDIDVDSLRRAAEDARKDELRPAFHPPAELLAEIERVRQEKEREVEAQQFEKAASLRDEERRLVSEASRHRERRLDETLAEVRRRLGLADE